MLDKTLKYQTREYYRVNVFKEEDCHKILIGSGQGRELVQELRTLDIKIVEVVFHGDPYGEHTLAEFKLPLDIDGESLARHLDNIDPRLPYIAQEDTMQARMDVYLANESE